MSASSSSSKTDEKVVTIHDIVSSINIKRYDQCDSSPWSLPDYTTPRPFAAIRDTKYEVLLIKVTLKGFGSANVIERCHSAHFIQDILKFIKKNEFNDNNVTHINLGDYDFACNGVMKDIKSCKTYDEIFPSVVGKMLRQITISIMKKDAKQKYLNNNNNNTDKNTTSNSSNTKNKILLYTNNNHLIDDKNTPIVKKSKRSIKLPDVTFSDVVDESIATQNLPLKGIVLKYPYIPNHFDLCGRDIVSESNGFQASSNSDSDYSYPSSSTDFISSSDSESDYDDDKQDRCPYCLGTYHQQCKTPEIMKKTNKFNNIVDVRLINKQSPITQFIQSNEAIIQYIASISQLPKKIDEKTVYWVFDDNAKHIFVNLLINQIWNKNMFSVIIKNPVYCFFINFFR
jgi:hypothetical protein